MVAYRAGAFAVAGQVFVQEVAICLATYLQPHGVIVVLLDFGNLDIAHHLAVVHHGKASGPAIVIHSRLGNAIRATDNRSRGLAVLAHFLVARIAEGITILGHEGNLLFELVGCPDIIAVKEGYPPALCLAESAIAAVGGTAVAVIFEVDDSFASLAMTFCSRHDLVGVVGAGVVNNNQFPVFIGLSNNRVDGLGDVRSRVIAGHDNRHQSGHAISPPLSVSSLLLARGRIPRG